MATVAHAIQILITGKLLADPALKKAGASIAGLSTHTTKLGAGLSKLGNLGKTALRAGIAGPAKLAAAAVKALAALLTGLVTVVSALAVGALALAAGLASVTVALSAGIVKAAEYAISIENIKRAFYSITGEAIPLMLDSLREASAFMVNEKQLLTSYNKAYMLLGKTLSDDLPRAYQYLIKVGEATGESSVDLMERLTRSVGRLSTRWMAYIGTVVSLEEATAVAAEMFGVQADELSRSQIQAAMWERVMMKLEARTAAMPDVLGTTNQMLQQLKATFKDIWGDLGAHFLPAARSLLTLLIKVGQAVGGLVREGGALYIPIRKLSAAFSVLFDILGEVFGKFTEVEEGVMGGLESFADKMISTAWKAIEWGVNIVTNLAIGLIKGASIALTGAMNFISGLLAYWLAPGSAPLIASNIVDWGASAFTEFLRGFTMADFDVLEGLQRPMKRALDVLVGLEMLGREAGYEMFLGISEGMAEALEEFGRTGEISGAIFEELAQIGGGYGESLAELLRRQLALATSVKALAAAEERLKAAREAEIGANKKLSAAAREYNKLVRQGADPAVLKAKLKEVEASYDSLVAAREETEVAEEAKDAAALAVKDKKEQVRLQERLLNQLIEMGQIMVNLAKLRKKESEEGYEIPEIEWPEFFPPKLDEAFEALKESIREKFAALWREVVTKWEESGVLVAIENFKTSWENLKATLAPFWDRFTTWWAGVQEALDSKKWKTLHKLWEAWGHWWTQEAPILWKRLQKIGSVVAGWLKENVWGWVLDEWQKWKDWWDTDGPLIEDAIQAIWDITGGILVDLWNQITGSEEGSWANIWSTAGTILQNAFDAFQLGAELGMEGLRTAISAGALLATGDWEGFTEKLEELWEIFWDWIGINTDPWMTNLATTINTKLDEIETAWSSIWENIKLLLAVQGEAFKSTWGVLWEDVKTAFTTKKDEVVESWQAIWEALKLIYQNSAFSSMITKIKDKLTGFKDALQAIREALQLVKYWIDQLKSSFSGLTLPSWLTPGSPTPLELGLLGIEKALESVNRQAGSEAFNLNLVSGGLGSTGPAADQGVTYYVTNHFGRDSVRSDADVYVLTEQIQRSLTLRGDRSVIA